MIPIPIGMNVNYASVTNFTSSSPLPRSFAFDPTNPTYPRYVALLQDSLMLTYFTSSISIPLSNLYAAGVNLLPALTWPPIIITQPTSSTVTHPSSSFFAVSASSELPLTYSWWSSSVGTGPFLQLTNSLASYMGTNTAMLTDTTSSVSDNQSQYYCAVSNARGLITSSIVTVTIN